MLRRILRLNLCRRGKVCKPPHSTGAHLLFHEFCGLIESKKYGAYCIGLLGNNGGKIKNLTDLSIVVPSTDTAKIQEVHRVIYHIICDYVEQLLK